MGCRAPSARRGLSGFYGVSSATTSHGQGQNGQAVVAALEAEQGLLGLLLYDLSAYDAVRDILRPEHFAEPLHGRLYAEAIKLLGADRAALPELIAPKFASDPAFHDLGGFSFLGELIDHAPHVSAAASLAQEIAQVHTRREIITLAHDAAAAAKNLSVPVEQILAGVEQGAAELGRIGYSRDHWIGAGDMVDAALDSAAARDGRVDSPFGIAELDRMTGGAHPGELTLVAGRPGMAKTTVIGRIALVNAMQGRLSLVFSLEMAQEPMGLRLGCDMAYERGAPRYSMAPEYGNPTVSGAMQNQLSPDQRRSLREAAGRVRELPLEVDVRSGLTLSQIEAAARRAYRRGERQGLVPGPLIIDHLGKVRPEKDRGGSRHAEMADVSGGAAELAKRLGVPVIACAQLNRAVEGRGEDKRPVLSDLRQAGELEEDARQVIFLYRPEYYYRPPEDPTSESQEKRFERERKLDQVRRKLFFLVEKNSHGPTGQVEAFCDIACSAVRDRAA
jgi:replicative DNA helicase